MATAKQTHKMPGKKCKFLYAITDSNSRRHNYYEMDRVSWARARGKRAALTANKISQSMCYNVCEICEYLSIYGIMPMDQFTTI